MNIRKRDALNILTLLQGVENIDNINERDALRK